MYTYDDKLKCLVRELALREKVYPRRVNQGKMNQDKADHEVAVIKAIIEDYKVLSRWENQGVFKGLENA